jgi:hypothetical protein
LSEEFRDIFDDMDKFYQKFTKRMFKEMEQIDQAIRSGKLLGNWDIKPIEEPGVKGFIARGHFQFGKPQSPQPLRPLKPFKLPEKISDEVREPLTDVFEELNVSEGQVEVKAKKFYKIIDLPTKDIEAEKAVANYKNGVLEVTIPRKIKPAEEKPKHTIKIE